jgi:hypothetical protein
MELYRTLRSCKILESLSGLFVLQEAVAAA